MAASLKVLGTYPKSRDEFKTLRTGSQTSENNCLNNLVFIGSSVDVVDLDEFISLDRSSSPTKFEVYPLTVYSSLIGTML